MRPQAGLPLVGGSRRCGLRGFETKLATGGSSEAPEQALPGKRSNRELVVYARAAPFHNHFLEGDHLALRPSATLRGCGLRTPPFQSPEEGRLQPNCVSVEQQVVHHRRCQLCLAAQSMVKGRSPRERSPTDCGCGGRSCRLARQRPATPHGRSCHAPGSAIAP